MKNLLFYFLMLIGGSLFSQQSDEASIRAKSKQFSQYFMDADFDKLAACYTKNGAILPPKDTIITGREAIKKKWLLPEGVSILHHSVTPVDITVLNKKAYDVGFYQGEIQKADGSRSSWSGKYIIIWEKVEGDWLIAYDIWNSN